jgi:hypothetical protein
MRFISGKYTKTIVITEKTRVKTLIMTGKKMETAGKKMETAGNKKEISGKQ